MLQLSKNALETASPILQIAETDLHVVQTQVCALQTSKRDLESTV
ncbi:MAG TPA: hypothetical protein VF173_06210 [Thermoanaerobaculia bacterium]|nr:hypothetical protein [Thermoanaerobaculia bacterium]